MTISENCKEKFNVVDFLTLRLKYKIPVVYVFINKINGKIYIGSASNLNERFYGHINAFKNNSKSKCEVLNRAFKKYGLENFEFGILEYLPLLSSKDEILAEEQRYFDIYNPHDKNIGYNVCPTAGSPLGIKRSKSFCEENIKRNTELLTNATLTKEDILPIFLLSLEGKKRREIAKIYNVHYNTITTVLSRTCWWHVHIDEDIIAKSKEMHAPKWTAKRKILKLAEYLFQMEQLTETYKALSKRFGICRRTIERLNKGLSFPELKEKYRPDGDYIAKPYVRPRICR